MKGVLSLVGCQHDHQQIFSLSIFAEDSLPYMCKWALCQNSRCLVTAITLKAHLRHAIASHGHYKAAETHYYGQQNENQDKAAGGAQVLLEIQSYYFTRSNCYIRANNSALPQTGWITEVELYTSKKTWKKTFIYHMFCFPVAGSFDRFQRKCILTA